MPQIPLHPTLFLTNNFSMVLDFEPILAGNKTWDRHLRIKTIRRIFLYKKLEIVGRENLPSYNPWQ